MRLFQRTCFTDSLLLSISLHFLPIVIALLLTILGGQGGSQEDQAQYEVEPTQQNTGNITPATHLGESCQRWYGGIGITYSIDKPGYVISLVVEGYPAYSAGLQVGDEIVNDGNIRGEPGTIAIVTYKRKNHLYTKHIQRDKICYSY